ncbi:hypothetical protein Pcinc_004642 [Petrolisthes cinctipes]|uniref:DDE Tnp4 domain-containing protein n=1 Tax=Petrolisthes cinctipes TaxID=88211 RepID=A0AAE1L3I9_PETCI|nr:hypothetical protein Pcinc_004642 [Petrolisthes cinctipes]
MTPVTNPTNEAEELYNRAHVRTRVVVERTLGIVKNRFRCIHRSGGELQYTPLRSAKIITACLLLHNRCVRRGIPDPNDHLPEEDMPNEAHLGGDGDRGGTASTFSVSITLPLCGVFIERYGWEATYLTSLPSLVWCLAWFTLVCDFPDKHPRISESESMYIVTKVKERGTYMAQRKGRDQKSVPWRSLITSVPLWATIIHSFGNNWCIAFFFTQLPTYMRNVLGFSIKSNGILSALPFASRYVGSITWSTLVDFSISRNYISLLASRKLACIVVQCILQLVVEATRTRSSAPGLFLMFATLSRVVTPKLLRFRTMLI